MTKSKRRPKAVKGALLIMVLTVMFVLIFLLAGTIAVVYSSHNRVLNKYEESQAYYTARSTLDVFIANFLKDNENVYADSSLGMSGVTAVSDYTIDQTSYTATGTNAKQGRAMELDIYKLAVDMDDATAGVQDAPTSDSDFPVWAKEYLCKKVIGTDVITDTTFTDHSATGANYKEKLESLRSKLQSDSATAASYTYWKQAIIDAANPCAAAFDHNNGRYPTVNLTTHPDPQPYASATQNFYDQYIPTDRSQDTMYYIVPAGTFAGYGYSSDNYGKLVDTVDQRGDFNGFGAAYPDAVIKVQLLERNYYLERDENSDFKFLFDANKRKKDQVKVKVTCTVYFDGEPTTTSIIYRTDKPNNDSSDEALTSMGGIGVSSNGFSLDGGMSSLDPSGSLTIKSTGGGGNIYTEGSLDYNDSGNYQIYADQSWVIKGDMDPTNSGALTVHGNNAFVYVGGTIKSANKLSFDPGSYNFAILAHKICTQANGSDASQGTIYAGCLEMKSNNNIKMGKGYLESLNCTSGFTLNTTPDAGGKYHITHDDLGGLSSCTINVAGHVILPASAGTIPATDHSSQEAAILSLYGYSPATNYMVLDASKVVFDNSNATSTFHITTDTTKTVNLEYHNAGHYTMTDKYKKKFTLPDAGGTRDFEVATARSRYAKYFDETCFIDATPDAGDNADLTDYSLSSITDKMDTGEAQAKSVKDSSNGCILGGTPSAVPTSGTIDAGDYVWNTTSPVDLTVDTASGNVYIQASSSSLCGNVKVTGTGKCYFFVPTGAHDFGSTAKGLNIIYEETGVDCVSNTNIYNANCSNPTKTPQIYYYLATGATISVNEGGGTPTCLQGFMHGPTASVSISSGVNSATMNYYTSDSTHMARKYWLIGTCVIGAYSGNNVGVAFVSPDNNNATPGDRLFEWADVYYTRGE